MLFIRLKDAHRKNILVNADLIRTIGIHPDGSKIQFGDGHEIITTLAPDEVLTEINTEMEIIGEL